MSKAEARRVLSARAEVTRLWLSTREPRLRALRASGGDPHHGESGDGNEGCSPRERR